MPGINKLSDLVSGSAVASWLLIALLIGYFVYKEWPEFRRRMSAGALKAHADAGAARTVSQRLDAIETDIREIKDKLGTDYTRLNTLDEQQRRHMRLVKESLREREIIMEALLGVLESLQEQGANGHTKQAAAKIRNYLNEQAHRHEERSN